MLPRQRAKTRWIVCSREVAVGGRGEKYTAHGRTSIVVVRLKDVSNGRTLNFQLRRWGLLPLHFYPSTAMRLHPSRTRSWVQIAPHLSSVL